MTADTGVADTGVVDEGIRVRIDQNYSALTPQEQRAADFILDHLDDLAVYSSTEIAAASGVSKATVSRLFRRLGFADAQEVREHARELRMRGVPVGAPRDLAAHAAAEHAALDRLIASLGDGRLDEAATLLAGARTVVVLGFRNSYPVALHLHNQLAQARDAVLLVGFRRRPAGFGRLLAALGASGVPVVLVSDPALRHDGLHLACPIESVGAFDSYASAMSLANLLATRVLALRGSAGRARVAGITGLYGELGELE